MAVELAFDEARFHDVVRAGGGPELFRQLDEKKGICFDPMLSFEKYDARIQRTHDSHKFLLPEMAMDAQSELVTVGSAAIPAFMVTYVDPKVIPILVSPMMAAVIAKERLVGDWLEEVAMFLTAESVGRTASYGDYSMNGTSNVNVNFPQRQNYLFQAFLQYGQRELGRAGRAKLDWASLQQTSNALVLMKALNFMYFFGVGTLQNYGLINDPGLYPAITPTYSWLTNASATANTIYQDVVRMWIQLQLQSNGTIKKDIALVLALSPENAGVLVDVTQYNTNSVEMLLKQNFPNLRIETAVEYATPSGQLVQLIAENIEGQPTLETAFSSKLMAHQMIIEPSAWKQKRSSGGWGTIWFRRFACASMLG